MRIFPVAGEDWLHSELMSNAEIVADSATTVEAPIERHHGKPIESRFLYVDVSALRAKQLRRGATVRLVETGEERGPHPHKPERLAMEEVRQGLVEWELPEFKAVFDTR